MTVADDPLDDGPTKDIMLHLQQLLLADNITAQLTDSSELVKSSDDYLDQLAPIIKDALVSHHAEELTSCLETITRTKDQEIEALCNGDQNASFHPSVTALVLIQFRNTWRPLSS